MRFLSIKEVSLTDGFWKKRQQLNAETTIYAVYEQFKKSGRFEALKHEWKEGKACPPDLFWDSDIAKWLESVAYISAKYKDIRLIEIANETMQTIIDHQDETGYFNSWYQVYTDKPRFFERSDHELYCAGHLLEAAIACDTYLDNQEFLKCMIQYIDYIIQVFMIDQSAGFTTPGHEEIELALGKLYEKTGEKRFLELMSFFVENRGYHNEHTYDWTTQHYSQDHLPVRAQNTAEGHSVRAGYLYCAMADLARYQQDEELKNVCETLFDNIVNKRMYITGGIGSTAHGEAFTIDYDLPNMTAYSESCAAISLMMFAKRMLLLHPNAKYADAIERVLYNGFLSNTSLDGTAFFYKNPLEIPPNRYRFKDRAVGDGTTRQPTGQRKQLFDCSCCPPNITRVMASIEEYIFSQEDDVLYVHQYMNAKTEHVKMETSYPISGAVHIINQSDCALALRIPAWCEHFTISANDQPVAYEMQNGYAIISSLNQEIDLILDMPVMVMHANPMVVENIDRVAVQRGPIVFCLESNSYAMPLKTIGLADELNAEIVQDEWSKQYHLLVDGWVPEQTEQLYTKQKATHIKTRLTLIPYYTLGNCPEESEMIIWLRQHNDNALRRL